MRLHLLFYSGFLLACCAAAANAGASRALLIEDVAVTDEFGCLPVSADDTDPPTNAVLVMTLYAYGTRNWTCLAGGAIDEEQKLAVWEYGSMCTSLENTNVPSQYAAPASFWRSEAALVSDFPGYGYYYNGGANYVFYLLSGSGVKYAAMHFDGLSVVTVPAPDESILPYARWKATYSEGAMPFPNIAYMVRVNTAGGGIPTSCEGKAEGEWVTSQYTSTYHLYNCAPPAK